MTDAYTELDRLADELKYRIEVNSYGTIRYFNENNKKHRLDGPAVIFTNGDKCWYINGMQYIEEEFNTHPLVIEYAKSKQQRS